MYHYIESVATNVYGDVVIYHFYPHGSKKIEDLTWLHEYDVYKRAVCPEIICHDQEPLNFDEYQNSPLIWAPKYQPMIDCLNLPGRNLRYRLGNIFDKCILLHSELNSKEVIKYQENNFVPVYHWSHAIIALDWFRYAQHVNISNSSEKKFLVYNRAWSNTREYRLKFNDLLIDNNLITSCQTNFNAVDPESAIHYQNYVYKNAIWAPNNTIENYLNPTPATSCSSADFNIDDYVNCDIEVVLETLFDDTRIQLTEKILRPIAVGKPFLLCSTPGSLDYLRSYGFKTFDGLIDESYDQITDPVERLNAVIKLMKTVDNLPNDDYQLLLDKLKSIAQYNKQYFFSTDFFNKITSELTQNLINGINELESTNTSIEFIEFRKTHLIKPEFQQARKEYLEEHGIEHVLKTLKKARNYYTQYQNK